MADSNTHHHSLVEPALSAEATATGWHAYGNLLVDAGKLSERDLDRAMAAQREMGGTLDRVLVSLGLVSEVDAARALAEHLRGAARRRAFRLWLEQRRAALVWLAPGYEHPGDPRQPDNVHRH